jgi:hypothetical protein
MASVTTPNGFELDDSGQRVVVDPICRIEGHLRIEVNLDENNVIRNAVSTGNMWRGLEVILKGRDPRDAWAFTERICGVCTGVHALQSVRAVEDALGIDIPTNANHIRNLMMLAQYCHDHIVHFYHLHALDWVDVVSALSADPKATSELQQAISPWPKSSPAYFRDVQNRLKRFVESGQLGPFANAYWGSPAYKLPPEANLMATTHYLEALEFQKEVVKIHTIFGGRNPHPNWVVGGMPCSVNVDDAGAVGAVNMAWLNIVSDIINQTITFTDQVYIPDLKAIASFYKDWGYGGGLSGKNVMSYGEFPAYANNHTNDSLMLPNGAILNGDLGTVYDVDVRDPEQVQEFVAHSWYQYPDEAVGLHHGTQVPARPELQGHAHRDRAARRRRQVLVAESAALERQCDGGGAAGSLPRRIRPRPRGRQGAGRPVTVGSRPAGDGPVLDARPHGRARTREFLGSAQDARGLRRVHGEPETWRHGDGEHGEIRSGHLGRGRQGRRLRRGAARRARPLGPHQGHEDRELPVCRAVDVERVAARSGRQYRRLRGRVAEYADGQSRAAAGDPADDPQLRPLPRLCLAHHVA